MLAPKLRADLSWRRQSEESHSWVVHDPLSCQFYVMSALEREAALAFDGQSDLAGLLDRLQHSRHNRTGALSLQWLAALISRMQQFDLLESQSSRDVNKLAARGRGTRVGWTSRLLNLLAIRIPLFDPHLVTRVGRPLANLLFQKSFLIGTCIAFVALLIPVLGKLLEQPLQAWSIAVQSPSIWLGLFLCLALAKTLHELGHILACSRYGVECREAGLLILCLTPCFYCDTTDAWKLQSKRSRAMIGFAGIYLEMLLACVSALIWLGTSTGPVHVLAGCMFTVCTISTLAVNLNPLLRYDGYYILSDLGNVPNLAEQSSRALRLLIIGSLTRPCMEKRVNTKIMPRPGLAAFGLFSMGYRTCMLLGIMLLAWTVLVPSGLGLIALALIATLSYAMTHSTLRFGGRLMQESRLDGRTPRLSRLGLLGIALVACLAFVFLWPLPRRVRERGMTRHQDRQVLYAPAAAKVADFQRTELGSTLRLEAFDSQLEELELDSQNRVLALEISHMESRLALDPLASFNLPAKRSLLEDGVTRQRSLSQQRENLQINAGQHQVMLPAFLHNKAALEKKHALASNFLFQQPAFGRSDAGRFVERGDLLGWIVQPESAREIMLSVPEEKVKRLRTGMACEICWDAYASERFPGAIRHIASEASRPQEQHSPSDSAELSGAFFTVSVSVEEFPREIRSGCAATVCVQLESAPLFQQAVEFLQRNLR